MESVLVTLTAAQLCDESDFFPPPVLLLHIFLSVWAGNRLKAKDSALMFGGLSSKIFKSRYCPCDHNIQSRKLGPLAPYSKGKGPIHI